MIDIKELYKVFEKKKVFILTNYNFKYQTSDLQVYPEESKIVFHDKFGDLVMLAFSEIKSIVEIRESSR